MKTTEQLLDLIEEMTDKEPENMTKMVALVCSQPHIYL